MAENAACELESVVIETCPLCGSEPVRQLAIVNSKTYWRCDICHLTFLSPESYLSPEDELARLSVAREQPRRLRLSKVSQPADRPSDAKTSAGAQDWISVQGRAPRCR